MGNKYLSEVIEEHKKEILGDNSLVLITAGVGAGKNTWIQNYLTQELDSSETILFITSRKLIKEQMLKDSSFSDDINFCSAFKYNYVITHHKLKTYFKDYQSLERLKNLNIKYLIIDEVHSLIADSTYTDTAFYLYELINYFSITKGIKVICLSATTKEVEPFFKHFSNFKSFSYTKLSSLTETATLFACNKIKAINKI